MNKQVNNHQIFRPGILFHCILALILCGNSLFAQITITASDFPHAGMLVVTNIDSTSSLSPGSAGTGQVWDFSNLVASYDDSTLYTMSGGQPGAGNHPDANLVAKDLDYDINYYGGYNYIFYKTTNAGWLVQGQELRISFWGMSFTWHMFYTPPALILPLPFTYNSTNNQTTTWKLYAATGFGGSVIDSVLTINHTVVSQLADASGTMITPQGSYDVLRVYEHTEIIDSSFKYNAGSGWVFDDTGFTVINTYHWYANGIGEVGNLVMDEKKGGGNLTCFKSSTIVGTDELNKASSVRIFPVPATDELNIDASEQISRTEIYSLSGELLSVNSNETRIDISDLKPGTYFLKVLKPKSYSTHKFIKQ
jgi:hypothetical protein